MIKDFENQQYTCPVCYSIMEHRGFNGLFCEYHTPILARFICEDCGVMGKFEELEAPNATRCKRCNELHKLQAENAALRARVARFETLIPLAKEVMHYCSGLTDNGLSWQNRVEFPKLAVAIQAYEEALEVGGENK